MSRASVVSLLSLTVALTVSASAGTSAQGPSALPLPIGKASSGRTSDQDVAVYRFTASSAGVLSIAVRAEADVELIVTDEEGQELPDGTADRDLFGSGGNEQLIVTLPEPGEYRVRVRLLSRGAATFDIGASWIEMSGFITTADPDRRPSGATALEVGTSREDSLNAAAGDAWDWFTITPKTAGVLTVILRGVNDNSPDLALELYGTSDFSKPTVRSDNDLQDNTTNESATMDVTAGQTVYVKVLGATSNPTGPYRIVSSLIQ